MGHHDLINLVDETSKHMNEPGRPKDGTLYQSCGGSQRNRLFAGHRHSCTHPKKEPNERQKRVNGYVFGV